MKIALAIPTYNAGEQFKEVLNLINKQASQIDYKLVVDSSSTDNTLDIAGNYGFNTKIISKSDFSHGGTRTEIAKKLFKLDYKYLIFMTQDVFLQSEALKNIIEYIKVHDAAVVRGKQEVDLNKGNLFEYFARNQNYGEKNLLYTKSDIAEKGIDTIFTSDAFAIYDLEKLSTVGYFGTSGNVSEDMFAAHKLIQNGYSIGYCSKAKVFHTHNYTIKQEYNRYIPIGNFYKEQHEWISKYGKTNQKGIMLVLNEMKFLVLNGKIYLIPTAVLRNAAKLIGFQIGKRGK
ncbi:rhamnosyltransferase [Enterococcus sp. DIV2402]|uniref:Rhamnosyltransferase n=1 Tax=Candidatus Enterococcus lowellii TaxID=2230877 RepID=A0ABZ2SS10_9ENTE|nr:glycosyltransferase [Enterococcus sp. DIV2402]MBO0465343.1 glycosyltransferase family 2 protein [Enterococcus sp. DIV2402]